MWNETKDDDDDGGFNDNGDDDDDDDDDDDGGNSGDDDGNFFDGVTANGDVSNIKHFIGETWWCFLKHGTLQVGEEITFALCTTKSEQSDCTALWETRGLCTLGLITFNGISTQFTEIHVGGAIVQTSWQCTLTQFTYINCTT